MPLDNAVGACRFLAKILYLRKDVNKVNLKMHNILLKEEKHMHNAMNINLLLVVIAHNACHKK